MSITLDGTNGITTPALDSTGGSTFTTLSASTSLTTPLVTNAGTLALLATGANIVTASTNGAERLRVDASGNVGIGTTNPNGYRINVQQAGADNLGINVTASNSTSIVRMLHNGTVGAINVSFIGGGSYSPLAFFTSDAERARIDASGNLLVGATATQNDNRLYVQSSNFVVGINGTNATGESVRFYNNGTTVGTISYGASSVAYNTTSDYRLKEDVQPMVGATDRLMALKPVNFAWKVNGSRVDGFLAHEAQAVVPECVTGEKDAVDDEGNPQYQGIDQSKIVPLLTAALQEALTKIEALEARVAALETNA
jgi:hypothetical protein